MKLWIIGNGFDLYHGLKTRYADYKAFLCHRYACCPTKKWQEDQSHELGWMVCKGCGKRYSCPSMCPVSKFNELPRTEFKEDLWRDLEKACALDLKKLMDEIVWDFVSGTKESPSVALSHGSLDFAWVFSGFEFYKWLCEIDKTMASIKERCLEIGNEDWFLTFNYTDTLQEVYRIPDERICYVHGRLKKSKGDVEACKGDDYQKGKVAHSHLLFGSPEITDAAIDDAIDYFKTLRKTSPKEMQGLRKHLKILLGFLKKDIHDKLSLVKRWVLLRSEALSSFEEVVVAGHSLGRYDARYFDLLADAFRSIRWRFMIHCKADLERAIEFCEQHRLHGYYMPWDTAGFEYVQCPEGWGRPNSRIR